MSKGRKQLLQYTEMALENLRFQAVLLSEDIRVLQDKYFSAEDCFKYVADVTKAKVRANCLRQGLDMLKDQVHEGMIATRHSADNHTDKNNTEV